MLADAQGELEQAQQRFDLLVIIFDRQYAKLKEQIAAGGPNAPNINQRRELLDKLVIAKLQAATAAYERSKAYDKGSEQQQQLARQAQNKFHDLFERYRRKAVGLFAGMFEGRCRQDLGDLKGALGIYESLLLQPDEPPIFREIKSKTLALALECWTNEEQKLFDKAADKGGKWLEAVEKSESSEDRTQYGADIRYFTALALDRTIESLQARNASPEEIDPKRKAIVNHAKYLTRFQNEHRDQARALLAKHAKTQP